MNLYLYRKHKLENSVIGELFINQEFECYTIEDIERPVKVAGKTAIPAGTYDINLTFSPRFKKYMLLLENVPGFAGIRIHAGNSSADTEGCLILGDNMDLDSERVGNSRIAVNRVFWKVLNNIIINPSEKVTITII